MVRELPHLLTREAFVASIAKWYSPPAADASSATNAACPTGDIEYLAYYPGRVAYVARALAAAWLVLVLTPRRPQQRQQERRGVARVPGLPRRARAGPLLHRLLAAAVRRREGPRVPPAHRVRALPAPAGCALGRRRRRQEEARQARRQGPPRLGALALGAGAAAARRYARQALRRHTHTHTLPLIHPWRPQTRTTSSSSSSSTRPRSRRAPPRRPSCSPSCASCRTWTLPPPVRRGPSRVRSITELTPRAANGTAPPVKLPPVLLDLLARHKTKTSKKVRRSLSLSLSLSAPLVGSRFTPYKQQQQQQQQQQQRLKRANAQARKRQKEERGAAAAAAAATIQPTAFVDLADANASPSRSFTTAPSPASKSKVRLSLRLLALKCHARSLSVVRARGLQAKKDAPAVVRIITRESAANAKSATSSPMALHQKAPSSAPNLSTSAKRDGKRKAPFDANKHAAPTAATMQPSTAAAAATSFAQSRTPSPHATPYTPSGAVPAVVPSAASAGTASSAAGPRARGGGNKRGGKRGGGARGRGGSDTKLS